MKPRVVVLLVVAAAACVVVWWLVGRRDRVERVGQVAGAQEAPAGEPGPRTLPVVPATEPVLPPAAPEKPKQPATTPGRGAPPGHPAVIERALAAHSQPELALLGQLARAELALPPAIEELFERRRRGDSPEELRRFVRARFPADMRLRLMTIRWINRQDPTRARSDAQLLRPSGKPLPSLGSIERVENPAPAR